MTHNPRSFEAWRSERVSFDITTDDDKLSLAHQCLAVGKSLHHSASLMLHALWSAGEYVTQGGVHYSIATLEGVLRELGSEK